jgi:hypothetical protein
MKETAVDYLFQKLWDNPKDKLTWYKILIDAKEIERKQIVEAYESGVWDLGCRNSDSKMYYKENYGKL